MNILFEEDGAFRAGVLMADNVSSLQVELPSGKRSKVKADKVMLRFDAPAAGELLAMAEAEATGIDIDFLWEVCAEAEFGFEDLAREYQGHKPTATEAAAVLLCLHSAPMYFHRKGRGRYRKAPADILAAAKAGLEKKRLQAETQARMAAQLEAGNLPAEFTSLVQELLYKPDRNRIETKALEEACTRTGLSVPYLLQRCGALGDTHGYHLGRFLFEYFPGGTGFPGDVSTVPGQENADPAVPGLDELPLADVRAFSIDDAHTTEIDDALSVVRRADGGMRVGIHIAAPGLGFGLETGLGQVARQRLSTVYMPGRKITMLPDAVVERFTLLEGCNLPALSLYLDVSPELIIRGHESRIERVPIVANLRHHDIEPLFNADTLATGLTEFPFRDELESLWELATVLESGRGKAGDSSRRKEYNFHVDWAATTAQGPGRIEIVERGRGSPIDVLVAELMIVVNATWGRMLADAGVPALYRAQSTGKVRMTTVAAPHEGLGVDCYAWTSSPLRRFVDLANQWQLIAHLRGVPPPYPPKSTDLLAALRDFELTYAAYADFQRGMERYWCLRWLLQEGVTETEAQVLREDLVRFEHLPLVVRLPSLPACPPFTRIRLAIERVDLLEAEIRCRFLEILAPAGPDGALGTSGEVEGAE
ncbi:MAG: RNB domain-containing ribonuclease [Proteobacteria bacterium]|nr:RNB domain-containing ribonuclease [Pseudomonadota bacterium]HQR03843.1 RNB domain-containing ribonuclease [Rhodocyclaceae bacterium]